MNQKFDSQQLLRLVRKNEIMDNNLSKEQLIEQFDSVYNDLLDNKFNFNIKKSTKNFQVTDFSHIILLRKLNDNIKRLYKDEQSNRRLIIKQIGTLLEETCPIWILKTDIESFYESIDRDKIFSKLKNDGILSYHSIMLIRKLFTHHLIENSPGLPRGICISATLSEIYMRNFDKWVNRFPRIYFYARFVDDIVIFSNNKSTILQLKDQINSKLESGLKKNESKTAVFNGNRITKFSPFEYLGYQFTIPNYAKDNKNVIVSISDKKVRKIKSRITIALLDFVKNKNFSLLENRIKFLTGNFSVKKSIKGKILKAGIFYTYSQINDYSVLKELNDYLLKSINSKNNSFGRRLSKVLDNNMINRLSKYSFYYGFKKRAYNSFTPEDMSIIVKCWL